MEKHGIQHTSDDPDSLSFVGDAEEYLVVAVVVSVVFARRYRVQPSQSLPCECLLLSCGCWRQLIHSNTFKYLCQLYSETIQYLVDIIFGTDHRRSKLLIRIRLPDRNVTIYVTPLPTRIQI
nr:unnamed protein product [Fasciola hepatica]